VQYLVTGERAALGPLRRDLVPAYTEWMTQPEVRDGIAWAGIKTEDSETKWFEEATKAGAEPSPNVAEFTIYDVKDDTPVGTIGLFDINLVHGSGTLGIVIGERRGQGIGTDAVRMAVRWGFDTLRLHNIILTVIASNEGAILAYERAGFEELGRRRGAVWVRGERSDTVLMQAVAS
jgi:diamine N-acetyltransferase